jgi:hypothetical protein
MLPTDLSKFTQGKASAELRDAHRAHHETLHAPAVIVPRPAATPAENVAAIHAAIAAAYATYTGWKFGAEVVIAPGVYVLDKTIEIRGAFGLRFRGAGAGTVFVWAGPADQPVFRVVNSRECQFTDFHIQMPAPGYAAIHQLRDAGAGVSPTHNHFRNLMIQCDGTTEYAVVIGGRDSIDANNDFHAFDQCTFSGYTDTGVMMTGSQAYNQQFRNCIVATQHGARYGYHTGKVGASIWVLGGGLNGHTVADFYIGRAAQTYVIQFVDSENSARFIEAPLEAYRQIVVESSRYAGDALHKDGRAIVTEGLINLSLRYCSIGDSNGAPPKNLYLHFDHVDTANGGGVVMEGCRVTSGADKVFSSEVPTRVEACTQIVVENTNTIRALTA